MKKRQMAMLLVLLLLFALFSQLMGSKQIIILGVLDNGWCEVSYNGYKGYIKSDNPYELLSRVHRKENDRAFLPTQPFSLPSEDKLHQDPQKRKK